MCDQVQGITLTRQLLLIALSDSLMEHWDKGDVFLAQLDDPSNTCCVLPKKVSQIYLLFWMWHKFVTYVTVTVITWAGHTRHMTGPHTKYFPTYFYNPDIFCLPFISFLLTGCSQDQWMHNASPFAWHQKTAKKINECVCVIMTWVTSWHHPGPRGQVVVTRHRVSAGASWLYDS